jgi:hypothetical protein
MTGVLSIPMGSGRTRMTNEEILTMLSSGQYPGGRTAFLANNFPISLSGSAATEL